MKTSEERERETVVRRLREMRRELVLARKHARISMDKLEEVDEALRFLERCIDSMRHDRDTEKSAIQSAREARSERAR